jgi:hypothetical protein
MKRSLIAGALAATLLAAGTAFAAKDLQLGAYKLAPEELGEIQKMSSEARVVELKELGSCLIGVGHGEIKGTDSAAFVEAQRTAEADAKGRMNEFINGLKTETSAESKTMEKVVSIVSGGEVKDQSQVEEVYTSTVRTQSKGVLRSTRVLASWTSDDGSVRNVAVVFSQKFIAESGQVKNLMRDAENTLSKKAQEGQKAIRSVGTAPVLNNDVAAARQRAVDFARENAVKEGLGSLVESETVADEMSTKIRLREKTRGYVIEDAVVSEAQEGQFYRVVLDAVVSTELLNKDLRAFRALQEAVGMPRVAVRLDEKWQDGTPGRGDAAAKLTELLQQNGYRLVSPGTPDPEVVIEGTCTLQDAGKDQFERIRVNASADYKAVVVSTHQILGSAQDTQRVAMKTVEEAASRAAKNASNQVFQKLHAQIVDQWSNMARSGSNFMVVLEKVGSYTEQGRPFQKLLEGVNGVGSVQRSSFNDGTLVLDVQYRGTASNLEDAVFAALEKAPEAALKAVDFRESQGNRLVFYCKK